MTVSWGNAERFDERAGIRLATATAPGATPAGGLGWLFTGGMRAGKAPGRSRREHMTKLPDHGDAQRIAAFLERNPGWSAFWDKRNGVLAGSRRRPHLRAVRGKRGRRRGARLRGPALSAGRPA